MSSTATLGVVAVFAGAGLGTLLSILGAVQGVKREVEDLKRELRRR